MKRFYKNSFYQEAKEKCSYSVATFIVCEKYENSRKIRGIATPVCALVRNDTDD